MPKMWHFMEKIREGINWYLLNIILTAIWKWWLSAYHHWTQVVQLTPILNQCNFTVKHSQNSHTASVLEVRLSVEYYMCTYLITESNGPALTIMHGYLSTPASNMLSMYHVKPLVVYLETDLWSSKHRLSHDLHTILARPNIMSCLGYMQTEERLFISNTHSRI